MSLEPGRINRLTVRRKTDIGYMLFKSEDEVFLHFNESNHRELKVNDIVDAFLYFDFKGRLSATLSMPITTIDDPAILGIRETVPGLGVFVDIGISKDVLLSKDDLPTDKTLWPRPGDNLFCRIRAKGRLLAVPVPISDIPPSEKTLSVGDEAHGVVQMIGKEGINILTDDLINVFVHHTMMDRHPRLGELVIATVTFGSDKGLSGSMIKNKELKMEDDSQLIYDYLLKYRSMSLTSDSSPEDIKRVFKMSKKAFKRALGALYKDRKIVFEDGRTLLLND